MVTEKETDYMGKELSTRRKKEERIGTNLKSG
jgi:hypothetical protein